MSQNCSPAYSENYIAVAKFAAVVSAAAVLSTPPDKLRPYFNRPVLGLIALGLFVAFVIDLSLFLIVGIVAGVLAMHIDLVEVKLKVNEHFVSKQCKQQPTPNPIMPERTMPLTMVPDDASTLNAMNGDAKDEASDDMSDYYSDYYSDDELECDIDDLYMYDVGDMDEHSHEHAHMHSHVHEHFLDGAPKSRAKLAPSGSSLKSSPYAEGTIPNHLALKMVVEADKYAEQNKRKPMF